MDDGATQQPQTDWQGNPPPAQTGPPPSWDEIKNAPEFTQLNPHEQLTTFNHWRGAVVNHASTLPGYDDSIQKEFQDSVAPEQQRLAGAAQTFLTQHPELSEPTLTPEGFFGTAARAFASKIGPAAAQAAGAVTGAGIGAVAGAPEGGVGAIPGAIVGAGAGGLGAGLLAERAQKGIMGDEAYHQNIRQMEINAQAHPYAHQIGTLVPFLVSAFTGGTEAAAGKALLEKVVTDESPKLAKVLGGAAERIFTGGLSGARAGALSEVQEKGNMAPGTVATGAGRGAVTMGAVGILPAMNTILKQAIKGIPDAYIMAAAGEVYDATNEHRAVDFNKISKEGGGGIAPFVLQNALLSWFHGLPMRAKSGEAGPDVKTPTKAELDAAIIQRQKDLAAQKEKGTITPDQQKELDDHNKVIQMVHGEVAAPEAQPPAAPEVAPATAPATPEAQPPTAPAPELPPEKQATVEKVNEGLAAAEDKQSPEWLKQNQQAMAAALEKSGVADQIEDLHAQRLTAKQIADHLGIDPQDVRAVRAVRGLPERTDAITGPMGAGGVGGAAAPENPEFTAWAEKKEKQAQDELRKSKGFQGPSGNERQAAETGVPTHNEILDKGENVYWDRSSFEPELKDKSPDTFRDTATAKVISVGGKHYAVPIYLRGDSVRVRDLDALLDVTNNTSDKAILYPKDIKSVTPAEVQRSGDGWKIVKKGSVEFGTKLPGGEMVAGGRKSEQERQAAEAQARTLPLETLRQEFEKPDTGFHDIIKAELDRRANVAAANAAAAAAKAAKEPGQALQERIDAKTEAEQAKVQAIQAVEDNIPPDRPFPKDIIPKTRDRELTAKQMWLEHIQDPEKDFKLQDLQKAVGKDAGTALYKAMWGEHEGSRAGRQVQLDEDRKEISDAVPTQGAEAEQALEQATPELVKQAEAPTEEATSPHEKILMDAGIKDPKTFLEEAVNKPLRAAGKPEMTMEQLAAKMQEAPTDTGVAAGKIVRTESSLPINPVRVLENTQHLANIGALDNVDPLGASLRHLSENGNLIQRFIAKLLLNSGIDTNKVRILFDDKMVQKALYSASPKKGAFDIYINRNSEHGKASIYGSLLHEALHHVTVWKLLPEYSPNAHEAVAIQTLDRLLARGRAAAWKEIFGRAASKEEADQFTKWLNDPNDRSIKLSPSQLFKLYDNYNKFYGLGNTKELVAEITNPELVDFLGRLPADTSIKGRALNLLHQVRSMIMQLVSGRPVEEQNNIQKYFESVAALTQEAPTRIGNTEIGLRAGMSPEEIDRLKSGMIPAGNKFLFSMGPYDSATNKLGKHTLPKSGEIDEDAFKKVGGVNKPLVKEEIAFYKMLVPTAFQNGKVNVPKLTEGLRLKGPQVEVKKLNGIPSENDWSSHITAINKRSEIQHHLETIAPNYVTQEVGGQGKMVLKQGVSIEDVPAELRDRVIRLMQEHNELYSAANNIEEVPPHTAKYSFIGPKPPEKMPGYVEGLVRLPYRNYSVRAKPGRTESGYYNQYFNTHEEAEQFRKENDGAEVVGGTRPDSIKYAGPHFGTEDQNVLSFYRGYEETLPNGEKAFHVIEVQSDWGQARQKDEAQKKDYTISQEGDKWKLTSKTTGRHVLYDTKAELDNFLESKGERTADHPLLPFYESLALKSAIQHAKEIGATKVILSDAETAMMTEAHDRAHDVRAQVGDYVATHLGNSDISDVAAVREPDYRVGPKGGGLEGMKEELEKDGDGGAKNFKIVKVTPELLEEAKKPLQEKGMRLHYDQTLPSEMEKLTGKKGESVDLGTHKNSVDLTRGEGETQQRFATAEEARNFAGPQGGISERDGEWVGIKPQQGSPVFKDEQGNPKTNITGKAYDLVKTPDEYTLTDRLLIAAGLNPDELPKNREHLASIMRDSGTPFIGNFLGAHDQMAQDALAELEKNPNAAQERLDVLEKHQAGATAEDFHLFRAQLYAIKREELAARKAGDLTAVKAADAKANNWMQEVFHKTAQAGKALQAVQGALDINTGDFFDLKSYYKMVYGKEFTPAMEKESQQIVQDTTQARVDTLKSEIKMGQEIGRASDGIINELGKVTKGTKLTNAEKKAAKAAGIETKKDAAGRDTGQLDFGFDLKPADAGRKLSEYLAKRFEFKPFRPGQKNLTIREVGQIWKFIKANYLDGTEYVRPDELIKDVTADLGLKDTRIIKEAIFAPKTIREFSAARYVAQSQQRAIANATKAWMEQNSKGTAMKWVSRIWEAPRTIAVIGHVNPSLTHAGSLLFRPSRWGSEIPSIGQAFNASFFKSLQKWLTGKGEDSRAYHEQLMQDVMNTKDTKDGEDMYAKLTSLGLAAKVGTLDDIGQYNTKLGKVGVAGNRGMDILKALRMDLGAKEYKVLKGKDWFNELDRNGKDEVLREMVSRINSETGTTTAGHTALGDFLSGRGRGDWRTFLFAPKLEGARWQQMVIDPFRAAGLWAKGNSATPAEKYFRNKVTIRMGELAGTYLGALTANAAILYATGSDDKINFKDPTRSDWLSFKVNGQTVIAPSSFLAPLRIMLSVSLAHALPWAENKQPYTDKIINYANGKLTPTIGALEEIARAKQNYTGRPIEALQKLYESMGIKFAEPRTPKDPISLYEWAATKGPIPLSATVEGWYNAMVQQGSSPELAKTIIGASIAMVSSVFAVHQHPTTPVKETNP